MSAAEPRAWTQARRQQMQALYPALASSRPGDVLAVDAFNLTRGQPVSEFSITAMRLAAAAAQDRAG